MPPATVTAVQLGYEDGDLQVIDGEGNLYVVARSKEAINRGGETIIPAEIEAALLTHPAIKAVACFAMPHGTLQETVGAVVVPSFGYSRISLSALIKHASRALHSSKWPAVLVYAEAIPLNTTGKLVRVKLAQRKFKRQKMHVKMLSMYAKKLMLGANTAPPRANTDPALLRKKSASVPKACLVVAPSYYRIS